MPKTIQFLKTYLKAIKTLPRQNREKLSKTNHIQNTQKTIKQTKAPFQTMGLESATKDQHVNEYKMKEIENKAITS